MKKMYQSFIILGCSIVSLPLLAQQTITQKHTPVVSAKKTSSTVTKKTSSLKKSASVQKTNEEDLAIRLKHVENQLAVLTQNKDNPKGGFDWYKIIKLSGLFNGDAYVESKPDFGTKGVSRAEKLSLATAKLNVDADVNDWVSGRFGLFYSDTTTRYYLYHNAETNRIVMDDVYATIANFKKAPFYFRIGQEYVPFGNYYRYPITKTLTQDLSETRDTAAELGFIDQSGLYGTVYLLDGTAKITDTNHDKANNGGVALGYSNYNHPVGFEVSGGYLNNMIDVGQINYNMQNSYYTKRVGAVALNGDIMTGPFGFGARYVSAIRDFAQADFTYQRRPGITKGAKPKAATFDATYTFKIKDHESRIILMYQFSREAHNINNYTNAMALPKYRLSAGYGIQILKSTILAFEYRRDRDYPLRNGGRNNFDNVLTARLTVLLA